MKNPNTSHLNYLEDIREIVQEKSRFDADAWFVILEEQKSMLERYFILKSFQEINYVVFSDLIELSNHAKDIIRDVAASEIYDDPNAKDGLDGIEVYRRYVFSTFGGRGLTHEEMISYGFTDKGSVLQTKEIPERPEVIEPLVIPEYSGPKDLKYLDGVQEIIDTKNRQAAEEWFLEIEKMDLLEQYFVFRSLSFENKEVLFAIKGLAFELSDLSARLINNVMESNIYWSNPARAHNGIKGIQEYRDYVCKVLPTDIKHPYFPWPEDEDMNKPLDKDWRKIPEDMRL